MKTQLKIKFIDMMNSGNAIRTVRLILILTVLISSFLFPEVAAAGPTPGVTGD